MFDRGTRVGGVAQHIGDDGIVVGGGLVVRQVGQRDAALDQIAVRRRRVVQRVEIGELGSKS